MNNEESQKIKITSFRDLNAWKEAHKLVLLLYELTKQLPRDEQFSLVTQLRRAVISITSNIAEGFSRESYREKVQFYTIARGSLTEVQSQIFIVQDLKYANTEKIEIILNQTYIVHKILSSLIKSSKLRI